MCTKKTPSPYHHRLQLTDHMDMARPPHENPEYAHAHAAPLQLTHPAVYPVTSSQLAAGDRKLPQQLPQLAAADGKHLVIQPYANGHSTPVNGQLGPPPGAAPVPIAIPVSHLALSSPTSSVSIRHFEFKARPFASFPAGMVTIEF